MMGDASGRGPQIGRCIPSSVAGAFWWHRPRSSLSGRRDPRAIAAHLATPETISRALGKLQDAGAIRFDRHRIIITNGDLLRSMAVL